MTDRSAIHGSFIIERTYDATPARVFEAFADPEAKARGSAGPTEWAATKNDDADFRVGGREITAGGTQRACVRRPVRRRYYDIVPNERIVYAYEMYFDENRISVSLATIELFGRTATARAWSFTEHGAFLDGYDDAGAREQGTRGLLDQLGTSLAR